MNNRNVITIDYVQIITRILSKYYWILLSVVLFGIAAYFVDRYQEKTYESEGLFLIDDRVKDNKFSGLQSDDIYEGVYQPLKNSNIKNQIIEFQTYNGIKEVIKKMNLELQFAVSGRVRKKLPFYQLPGVGVEFDSQHVQPINVDFIIHKIDHDHWNLKGSSGIEGYVFDKELKVPIENYDVDYTFTQSIEVENSSMSFQILLDHEILRDIKPGSQFVFTFYSYPTLISIHRSNLSFSLYEKGSTIMRIQYLSYDPKLGVDFIDIMMNDYLIHEISLRRSEGEKMLQFINEQLSEISKRMSKTESDLKGFGIENSSLELETQSNENFKKIEATEDDLYDLELTERYYSYLQASVDSSKSVSTISFPFTLIEGDPLLINLLERLNALSEDYLTEQERHLPSKRKLKSILEQFEESKLIVSTNLKKLREDLAKKIDHKQSELDVAVVKEHNLPEAKLTYLRLKRNFSIDDEIYTFLLQSRTEMNVRLSAVTPNNRIINNARLSNVYTGIERKIIFFVALLLGVIIPSLIIIIYDFVTGKVYSDKDLYLSTSVEPIAVLGHYRKRDNIVQNDLRNPIDEEFSKLRLLILHRLCDQKSSVLIAVTSSQEKEGKSFTAVNLALSMAYYGKKTLLVEADLKKPKLGNHFIQSTQSGLADYLSNQASIKDITNPSYVDNLHVVFSGTVEDDHYMTLDDVSKLKLFFTAVKKKYDMVIVDTAPVGVYSETLNVIRFVDYIAYVARANITTKLMLENLYYVCDVCKEIPSDYILNDYRKIGSSNYPYGNKTRSKV